MPSPASSPAPVRGSARELAVVILVAANLLFLPWAFGGVDPWAQQLAALCATAALLCALAPGSSRRRPTPHSTPGPWIELLRFPVFWAGLALFAYVVVQHLNPAYTYHRTATEWWLEPATPVRWLPAGMSVPFAEAGGLRSLLLWYAPWAAVCACWIGVTRRTLVVTLLTVVAVNGFAVAAFGVVQLAAGQAAVYGMRVPPSAEIFASFLYRNHAAAYFGLVAAGAFALALHALRRDRDRGSRQGPTVLYFLFAAMALAGVVLSFSFLGTVLVAAVWLPLGALLLVRRPAARAWSWPGAIAAAAIAGLMILFAAVSGGEGLRAHARTKLEGGASFSARSRMLAAQQGWKMFRDRPAYGWGAGDFRYGFTKYQSEEPEITYVARQRYFWPHVHNDWLELLIELGVVGVIPVVAMLGSLLATLVRARFWQRPFLLWGAGGLLVLALHAGMDFPLQNPAVLFTGAITSVLLMRWAILSAANGEPKG